MTGINQEKRKYPRYKIKTQAVLEMFDGSLPISVAEMSVEGFRIQVGTSIEPETHIAIRINVGREIVFHGQIVWVAHMMTANGPVYNMGIQTDAILDRGEEIIDFEEREILVQDLVIILKRG